jgi:uncharacterized membrane protein
VSFGRQDDPWAQTMPRQTRRSAPPDPGQGGHGGHDHGHGHGHGGFEDWPDSEGAARVRRILMTVVIVLGVGALAGLAVWWPRGEPVIDREAVNFGNRVDATVTSATVGPCSFDPAEQCNTVEFRITSGSSSGSEGSIETSREGRTPAATLREGDDIIVTDAGAEAGAARYSFADVERGSGLLILVAVFAGAVVALGRLRGLLALLGIVLSGAVLLGFVFPALLQGTTPIGVALTGAAVIAFGTLYLAHGVNDRTTVALLGTLASLLLTAGLAAAFAGVAELSGLASEESLTLMAFAPELDFRGLLVAAVVIGALGVLDDVTITQVSAVWELRRSDPDAGARQLYASGIRIGRDHIASTVNTLVLAYTAAALPLLLLFTQSGLSLGEVLTSETVAVEIVQTLVGSIGLVASVPLTTALACWVATRAADDDVSPSAPRRPRRPDEPPPSNRPRRPRPDQVAPPGPGRRQRPEPGPPPGPGRPGRADEQPPLWPPPPGGPPAGPPPAGPPPARRQSDGRFDPWDWG